MTKMNNCLLAFSQLRKYRTSMFECLMGNYNALFIALCKETSGLVKNILPT